MEVRRVAIALPEERLRFWMDFLQKRLPRPFVPIGCSTEHALRAADPEIVVGHQEPMAALLREPGAKLRWGHLLSAGADQVIAAMSGTRPKGFRLTRSSGIHDATMREYVLMAMLYFCKDVPLLRDNQAAQRWSPTSLSLLAGKTLLSIGTGAIGAAVAQAASSLGMRTWGVSMRGKPHASFLKVVAVSQLLDILPAADFVLLALPLTTVSKDLLDARAFSAMRRGVVLINIARGAIVDDSALLAALQSGQVAGAALDAFREEPLDDKSPWWTQENVLVTPHVSGRSADGHRLAAELFHRNLQAYADGRPLEAEVDFRLGY